MNKIDKYPTLYLKNLNQKININDMKISLYILFSQYGKINDIIIRKCNEMRGQAFVIFHNLESSENALIELQNYYIFDKKIIIERSNSKSNITLINENNFYIKPNYIKFKNKIEKLKKSALNSSNKILPKIIFSDNCNLEENVIKKLFGKFPYLINIQKKDNKYEIEYKDGVSAITAFKYLNNYEVDINNKLILELV